MPVNMEMIENGRVIRYVISAPWRIVDFTATFPEAKTILDAALYPVHGVVNLYAAAKDPMGVLNVRKHPSFSHVNGGYTSLFHASLLPRRITENTPRIARFYRYMFFYTEHESTAFLQ